MTVLRYQRATGATTLASLSNQVGGTINSISAPAPGELVDIDVAGGAVAEADVTEELSQLGYTLIDTNPATPLEDAAAAELPAHASTHENGGSDEINVAGLSGVLADPQTPTSHAIGGASHTASTLAQLNTKVSDATLDDASDPRTPTVHALGGAEHSSSTLAQLNTLVSDATLDDAGDPRTPTAHAIGGASHTASTLAQLNTKVSDATLDDASDPRTPTTHALGGAEHSASTLAQLNTKVSDATLDDASSPRTPTAHAIGGASHTASTLAQLNTKVSDATLDGVGSSRPPSGAASGQLGGTYPGPDVRGIRESGGTQLTLGSISDGQVLQRSGTTVIGTAAGAGDVVGPASATDTAIARYNGATGKLIQNSQATLDGAGRLGNVRTASFSAEAVATPPNVNWQTAQKQSLTLTGSITAAFTNPTGAANLMLRIVQGGTGSYTITWPGTVRWAGGAAPTLSTAVGAIDIVALYWNGTNYYGVASLNFV